MLDLSATERQMALNEVRVLATLDHPNIVTYYDSFERDGMLMIEMEYADGGNLAETLAKKTVRMEEKEIVNIFSQIVSAIRHMHDNNVLHRDLKTANIFLTKENMVKVGDFGISKVLVGNSTSLNWFKKRLVRCCLHTEVGPTQCWAPLTTSARRCARARCTMRSQTSGPSAASSMRWRPSRKHLRAQTYPP